MTFLLPPYDESPLAVEDIQMLNLPMAEEVTTLLPVPATVEFYSLVEDSPLHFVGHLPSGEEILAYRWGESIAPVVLGSILVVPVIHDAETGQVKVVLTVREVDPALLAKMSASWLTALQSDVIRRILMVREIHTDPDTGMYNRRAIRFAGQYNDQESSYFIFLSTGTGTGTGRKNAAGRMLNDRKSAAILRTGGYGPLFSLNSGVYGILLVGADSQLLDKVVRVLQRDLKRDGISRVQVGFASGGQDGADMVDEAWRCLGEAEKRGPFGVCDASMLDYDPFALPSRELLRTLQGKWKGVPSFYLAVFKWGDSVGGEGVEQAIVEYLQGRGECIGSDGHHTYVLFAAPECSERIASIQGGAGLTAIGVEYVGIAGWPCLRFSKTETVRSAMKALRHCSFLESGAIVVFDHLSLNISGDVYFDLGDYHAAAGEYRRGLLLEPHDLNLLNSLGVTLVEFNRHGAAMKCFQEVLCRHPNDTMALVNLGFSQQALGMKREAMKTLESAVSLNSDSRQLSIEILLPLSRLYIEFRRFEEAVVLLEQWAGQQGNDRDFILYRLSALCYYELDRRRDAVRACQKALRIHPQDSVCLSLLGLLYVEEAQGDDIGLRLCNQALEIDPVNSDNYLRLGRAMVYMKNYDNASEAVKKCLQLDARHTEALLLLSHIYILQEKGKQAVRLLRRVVQDKQCTSDQYKRAERWYAAATGGK